MRNTVVAGVLLAASLWSGSALAQNELLDSAFGDGGFRLIDSTAGDRHRDSGIATCPGPGNTEVVIGGQWGTGRITVVRLLDDGTLDASFGDAGMTTFEVSPADFRESDRTLCLGNGRAVVARMTFITGHIHLFRIGSDGLPDPAFGGGEVVIDPATLPGGVAGTAIQGMDPAPNGEILLTGGSPIEGGMAASPFLIRLHADGSLRDARVLSDPGFGTRTTLSTAGYGSDGSLMLLGTTRVELAGRFYSRWFSAVLNGVDLSGGVADYGEIAATETLVIGGRMLRPGVLVAAAAHMDGSGATGQEYEPRILVFRRGTAQDGVSHFDLPTPPLPMAAYGHMLVATDPARMLFATGLRTPSGPSLMFYFSQVRIGSAPAEDGVDALFGNGGSSTARRELTGCEPDHNNWQSFKRVSLWRGRPVFVGQASAGCVPGESDVIVGRLAIDRIFGNGFE